MSTLQDYLRQIGLERRIAFENAVQEINGTVGNDVVHIIVGENAATVYYGTQSMEWPYYCNGEINPLDTKVIEIAGMILKNSENRGAWEEKVQVGDQEVTLLQNEGHWADKIENGEQWKEAMLRLIRDAEYLGAWPTGRAYETKTGRIVIDWGSTLNHRQKSYAYNLTGWLALIDDISGTFTSYHGRYARV